ncbi:MAG: hypothetical protein NTV06_00950, partial [candidate division Zixibacteria bacterium]|nr:hypothetical protein [candidate division Zixibacteria bacterium]
NKITALGINLDPIADKIFTITLSAELIFYRRFPLRLAFMIIAREIIIMSAGAILLRRWRIFTPSSLTGKYYFGAISILILSYITIFPFGQVWSQYLAVILLLLSIFNYGKAFWLVIHGGQWPIFADRKIYKWIRLVALMIALAVYFYRFYFDILVPYWE